MAQCVNVLVHCDKVCDQVYVNGLGNIASLKIMQLIFYGIFH